MSYDISFRVKVEGTDKWLEVGDCDANITWNVRKIIELSTGLPWKNEANNGYCKDVIPYIAHGLRELKSNPDKYRPYEAENGWGTVEGTIHFFEHVIEHWDSLILLEDKEIADVATFWIT